jgi:MFS family permease
VRNYHSNIPNYFLLSALRGAATGMPIVLWVVFLQQRYGYSLTEVTLLDLPFWLGIFLFEIPTGIVADKYGRKLSLTLSALIGTLMWLVFASSGEFWVMASAQFVGGLAVTFSSGADEALLYETTKALNREADYATLTAQARAVRTISAMLAGLAVSAIATVDLALPAFLTAALIAATLLPILSFKETGGKSPATSNLPAQDTAQTPDLQAKAEHPPTPYSHVLKLALATLREHVTLRWAIAYLVILGCLSFYTEVFLQPYTLSVGLPIVALGAVMVTVQAMSIAGSLAVPHAQKTLGTDRLLYAVPLLLIPCLLLLGTAPIPPVLLVAALSAFLFALTEPVLLAAIQRRVPDHARATVLSIKSLFATIFLTLTEPALGLLSDNFGVHTAYLGMAALIALFSLTLLLKGRRWVSTHSPT